MLSTSCLESRQTGQTVTLWRTFSHLLTAISRQMEGESEPRVLPFTLTRFLIVSTPLKKRMHIIFQNARSPYQRVWPSFLTRQLDFVVKCLCL